MRSRIARYIRQEKLLEHGQPVRVAVSGGVDSTVLVHVLRDLGHPCSVVHVDHGLRGSESDTDAAFVQAYCHREKIPFVSTRVDVESHAKGTGISTQMAARELRYKWFHELHAADGLSIALAHHSDDAVETLLINLMRGTGTHGWAGIRPKTGPFVRPLLATDRSDILLYAREHAIAFREDGSNSDPHYLRNRIRHEVLPLLEELRPGALRAMGRSVTLLRELETVAVRRVDEEVAGFLADASGRTVIPFGAIEACASPSLLLNTLLRPLGFHPDVVERVHDAIAERRTGALFAAQGHQVNVDRDGLLITPVSAAGRAWWIERDSTSPADARFTWSFASLGIPVPTSMNEVWLDADRLSFPLELRPWHTGDRIRPMGLGGSKLVSDVLIDARVPLINKADTHVLVSAGEVVWVAGHRLAEGYRAGPATRNVLHIRIDQGITFPTPSHTP
ncbi:MAG: tRNA lysidine(34) synthetase TilS [Bacteroidetes bacterium]|nr:tRNA lysidine(34) synthetase TilS [Bacteroidota bacterium]MCC6655998.1 tRNA lysidine(34) synthetase TilS [Flavobacteriales bacterium]HMU13249.1 tRNA lysidine(34) synthetase TilS [Flavobacteriales bacterium]